MYRIVDYSAMPIVNRLEAELRALEADWTVGNYFERLEEINEKKAEIAKLKRI
jgi:hypothetical protein